MATKTSNYDLIKPSPEDFYNVEDQNTNMDVIDAELKKLNENKADAEHEHDGIYETPEEVKRKVDAAEESAKLHADQIVSAISSSLNSHMSDTTAHGINNKVDTLVYNSHLSDTTYAHGINNKVNVSTYNAHIATNATEGAQGHVQLATSAEALSGISTSKAVTPASLEAKMVDYGNVVTKTDSFILTAIERNKVVQMTGEAAQTVTIPANASVAFKVGTQITFIQQGAGTVTFVPASGVTLLSKDTKRTIDGQYAGVTLIKTALDTWSIIGALK